MNSENFISYSNPNPHSQVASIILILLNAAQTVFSGYNLYLASMSIRKLQKYEDASKEAAKYSNIAENQLYKTRTTQASAALAVLASFISSSILTTYPLLKGAGLSTLVKIAIAGVNIAVLFAAREHVGDFWTGKAKIPLPKVGDYNDAITVTQEVRLNMVYLIGSWIGVGFGGLVF